MKAKTKKTVKSKFVKKDSVKKNKIVKKESRKRESKKFNEFSIYKTEYKKFPVFHIRKCVQGKDYTYKIISLGLSKLEFIIDHINEIKDFVTKFKKEK